MEKNDLDKYVQKVLEIQQEQKKNLSQEELKAVALSIGLTEDDWKAVEKSLADNLTRGEGFLKYQNWADAIEEFQNCQTIRPMHLESLLGLTEPFKIAEEYIVSAQLPPIKAGQTFVKSATFQLEGIENKKVNRTVSVASIEF